MTGAKTSNLIFVTRDGWQSLADGVVSDVPAWLKLNQPSVVITDFEEASIGCYRFDGGKAAYALPMIEKRARTEGLTDGAAHVIAHRVLSLHGGFQSFHSIVALDYWQRVQQWATEQKQHCLLVPLGALLCTRVSARQARVLCMGRTLHCFGQNDAGLFHATANAIGQGPEEMLAAVRVLTFSCAKELSLGVEGPVNWVALLNRPELDQAMVAQWNETAPVLAQMAGSHQAGNSRSPAGPDLTGLLKHLEFNAAVNPLLDRAAWWSERYVHGVAGGAALVAAALLAVGLWAQAQSQVQRASANRAGNELALLESRIQAASQLKPPESFTPISDFVGRLGQGQRYNPIPVLATLKRAAGADMRIQRLRLESSPVDRQNTFRVDGVVGAAGTAAVSRFVSELRFAGWTVSALEPADTVPGAFSYRLVAAAAAN